MKFFGKKSTKKSSPADDDHDHNHSLDRDAEYFHRSESSSPTKTSSVPPPPPPKSPPKPATASSSPTKKSVRPASPATPTTPSGEPRQRSSSNRHFSRASSDLGKSTSFRRKKVESPTHPLNLPPEEIKRLSRLSTMSARESVDRMDVDTPTSAATPSSPPQRQATPPSAASATSQQTRSETPPAATNGSSSPKRDDAPAPPPHKTDPNSPPPTPADEAEVFKNLGNKFFKERNYRRAIEEYSKGGLVTCREPVG